jgi:hypothetical protein
MDLREVVWEGEDWIHLAQDRPVVGPCEHGNEPSGSIKGGEFLDSVIISFSRRTLFYVFR